MFEHAPAVIVPEPPVQKQLISLLASIAMPLMKPDDVHKLLHDAVGLVPPQATAVSENRAKARERSQGDEKFIGCECCKAMPDLSMLE